MANVVDTVLKMFTKDAKDPDAQSQHQVAAVSVKQKSKTKQVWLFPYSRCS